ncbi:MAG: polyprenyl synthetase family protein [Vicinamibacterales bacterium]
MPDFLVSHQRVLADELSRHVPSEHEAPEGVHRAMRYTLLAPSKRVRGVLAFLSAELCGHVDRALPAAVAVELVHAASLILDDLPCMDDAPLRRGRPSNHVAFGEATALLAAFALLSRAFGVVADGYPPAVATRITKLLADTVGSTGLIAGQADDLEATGPLSFERLERIHRLKTGVLFNAAAVAGALGAGGSPDELTQLSAYAKNLGLAFQIIDDMLDVTGDPAVTGKAARQDAKKTTFVAFSGLDGARALAQELCDTADQALAPFGPRAERLRKLSAFVAGRRH